jgi:hypothetical protein
MTRSARCHAPGFMPYLRLLRLPVGQQCGGQAGGSDGRGRAKTLIMLLDNLQGALGCTAWWWWLMDGAEGNVCVCVCVCGGGGGGGGY